MIAEAMVLTGPRSLQRRQMIIPDVGDRGAILRVEACGLCGTDHEQFTGHLPAGFSFVPGHEIVGIVEHVGAAAANAGVYKPASAWPLRCSGPAETAPSAAAANTGGAR